MKPVAFLALAALSLPLLPLQAQISGRWKLTLADAPGAAVRGELRLGSSSAGAVLLLENRDERWLKATVAPVPGDSVHLQVEGAEPMTFAGRRSGGELEGVVLVRGERRYRWRGTPLDEGEEFYPSLPRFRQRQVVVRPPLAAMALPGTWVAAATAQGETPAALRSTYTELALQAGVTPLPPESLPALALFRAMGLYQRPELVAASVRSLEKIRASLGNDTAVARFDHLFRPGGRWQVDIHDVALARVQRPLPGTKWESAREGLAAAGLLEQRRPGIDEIPLALYRLFALSVRDTAAWRTIESKLRQVQPSGSIALALVRAYEEASEWYPVSLRFLLEQRWIGTPARSPAELVRAHWAEPLPIPEVRSRVFGYPEGAVRMGTDSVLASSLVQAENQPARDWLARHGYPRLLETLHRLDRPMAGPLVFRAGPATYRVTSVGGYAAESFSGFLEPRDLVLLDPSYMPLLALGTLVHEWQHLLQGRSRRHTIEDDQLILAPLDPFMAEGLAEWLAVELLAGAAAEHPLVLLGESEKRLSLPQNDPHQLGYLLARTVARTLDDPAATRILLERAATDPQLVASDPRIRRRWPARGPDRALVRQGNPVLVPGTVFTVEDRVPDLVQSDIVPPPGSP